MPSFTVVMLMLLLHTSVQGSAVPSPHDLEAGTRRGMGVQCTPYSESQPSGPISYRVSDIGKPGVPRLRRADRLLIARMLRYVPPRMTRSLRFAMVGDLIVYAAISGICADFAPGYPVLNGDCNSYYEPGEDPTRINPGSGCLGPPRPWMSADRGLPGDPTIWMRDPP